MQDAADAVPSGMVSILGLEARQDRGGLRRSPPEGEVLQIANYLCPGNIVVSGHKAACDRVADLPQGRRDEDHSADPWPARFTRRSCSRPSSADGGARRREAQDAANSRHFQRRCRARTTTRKKSATCS